MEGDPAVEREQRAARLLDVVDAGERARPPHGALPFRYNVCRDGEYVSNRRFTEAAGWHPISSESHSAFVGL